MIRLVGPRIEPQPRTRLKRLAMFPPDEYGRYLAVIGALRSGSALEVAEVIATAEGHDRKIAAVSLAMVESYRPGFPAQLRTPSELDAEIELVLPR